MDTATGSSVLIGRRPMAARSASSSRPCASELMFGACPSLGQLAAEQRRYDLVSTASRFWRRRFYVWPLCRETAS
uniref:Uncharacterized protein n=1 Tax=Ralstonia solanacearum TaxID=305 RepID=A0A0S4VWW7_RALSL|nr:protein of unknown function [Ralstonia solanacearum]